MRHRLTAALLRLRVLRLADLHDLAALAERILSGFAVVEGLARDNAINLWRLISGRNPGSRTVENKPVRIFWKASSTLLASRADVSMKERLLSPARVSIDA